MPDEPLPGAAVPSSSEPPLDPEPPASMEPTPPSSPEPPAMEPPTAAAPPPMIPPSDGGGDMATTPDQRNMAMLAHLSCLLLSLLGPLVILLVNKDGSPFVEAHAREAINFQINLLILTVVGAVLTVVLVGMCILVAAGLLAVIMPIIAGLQAHGGQTYRYPYTIRFLG